MSIAIAPRLSPNSHFPATIAATTTGTTPHPLLSLLQSHIGAKPTTSGVPDFLNLLNLLGYKSKFNFTGKGKKSFRLHFFALAFLSLSLNPHHYIFLLHLCDYLYDY